MRIFDWNVNGLRAIIRKNALSALTADKPDIICLQETKTNQPLPFLLPGFQEFWGCGVRPGYSGTLMLVRDGVSVTPLFDLPELLSAEGRTVGVKLADFYLLNTYFPNGGQGPERLHYKMNFYAAYLEYVRRLDCDLPVIFTGDVNTAHQEIDLAHPKENSTHTGFLPEERAWLDQVVESGFADVWRLRPEQVAYSWWDYKTRARERNVGWRIDYFFASARFLPRIASCEIKSAVLGSDHAPLLLDFN